MTVKTFLFLHALFLAGCSKNPEQPAITETLKDVQFSPIAVSETADLLAKGQRLTSVLGCRGCHGPELQGQNWDDIPDYWTLFSSNLTRAVAKYDSTTLERAIRHGIKHDGSPLWVMPSENFIHLADDDVRAVVSYLETLRPAGSITPAVVIRDAAKEEIAAGTLLNGPQIIKQERTKLPIDVGADMKLGRYITSVTCAECHGFELHGDDKETPDLNVVGGYSREEFGHLLKTGEPIGGRKLGLMASAAIGRFSLLTDAETEAVYRYLTARALVKSRDN